MYVPLPGATLLIFCLLYFAVSDFHRLWHQTKCRQRNAFRPGTRGNHQAQFSLYIAFCLFYGVQDINPSVQVICMYVEFLTRTFTSPRSIRNYVSGVRLLHKYLGQTPASLYSFQLDLMLRALDITMFHTPLRRQPIDLDLLQKICDKCDVFGILGKVVKCAFIFGFFGFLRQSNLAPRTALGFDRRRHTCRGDVLPHSPGLVLLLKWTKTKQNGHSPSLIPLPDLHGHPLCPVACWLDMCRTIPAPPNAPLFVLKTTDSHRILTIVQLGYILKQLIASLGLNPEHFSLHSLRRGGATSCYNAGVELNAIRHHGTWQSDAFWTYIVSDPGVSRVAQGLKRQILQT